MVSLLGIANKLREVATGSVDLAGPALRYGELDPGTDRAALSVHPAVTTRRITKGRQLPSGSRDLALLAMPHPAGVLHILGRRMAAAQHRRIRSASRSK